MPNLRHPAVPCLACTSLLLLVAACTTNLADTPDTGGPAPTTSSGTDEAGSAETSSGGASGSTVSSPLPAPQTRADFTPLQPTQYGSKVKALLTGMPLSNDEYSLLAGDDTSLASMVDTWMATPQWQKIMLDYFRKVFQTGTYEMRDYGILFISVFQIHIDWSWNGWHTWFDIIDSIQNVFPRTALALVNEDAPFHQILTTSRYMMNTPMMAMSAFLDTVLKNDDGVENGFWMADAFPNAKYTRQATRNIDPNASMDPSSPDFMNWFDPSYDPTSTTNLIWCKEPFSMDWTGKSADGNISGMGTSYAAKLNLVHLFGGRRGCTPWAMPGARKGRAGAFTDADWATWKWVDIRQPQAGEQPTVFTNVPKMRAIPELVLRGEQAGFMTTVGFLENWMTNKSNADRALVNQALIVGLDYTFAPQEAAPTPNSGDPSLHAVPGTQCYSCHQSLDPAVHLFRQSYSLNHRTQMVRPADVPAQGRFAVPGAPATTGTGVGTLGAAMAAHPRFAVGWVQKMCRFATSASCLESDPAFQEVVQAFVASDYKFSAMVKALMLSPLVTEATYTDSAAANTQRVSIARRDQLCSALEARLGWPDICQQRIHGIYSNTPEGDVDNFGRNLRAVGATVADSVFTRGQVAPAMPTAPDLFYMLATDKLCVAVAQQVVDGKPGTATGTAYPQGSRYSSADVSGTIASLVRDIMGVPDPDPRSPALSAALTAHHANALAAKASATDALRSTFVAACEATSTLVWGL